MMPSEETASLSNYAWSVWDAHCPSCGFTGSIVPATGLRMKRPLSEPLRKLGRFYVPFRREQSPVAPATLPSSSGSSFPPPTSGAE
jgi:hypothetical protein